MVSNALQFYAAEDHFSWLDLHSEDSRSHSQLPKTLPIFSPPLKAHLLHGGPVWFSLSLFSLFAFIGRCSSFQNNMWQLWLLLYVIEWFSRRGILGKLGIAFHFVRHLDLHESMIFLFANNGYVTHQLVAYNASRLSRNAPNPKFCSPLYTLLHSPQQASVGGLF